MCAFALKSLCILFKMRRAGKLVVSLKYKMFGRFHIYHVDFSLAAGKPESVQNHVLWQGHLPQVFPKRTEVMSRNLYFDPKCPWFCPTTEAMSNCTQWRDCKPRYLNLFLISLRYTGHSLVAHSWEFHLTKYLLDVYLYFNLPFGTGPDWFERW